MRETRLNKMPAPTWNRLDINDITVRLPEIPHTVSLCAENRITALGAELCELVNDYAHIADSTKLDIKLTDSEPQGYRIHADKDLAAIMYITGKGIVRTFAQVSDNAKLRLVQIIEGGNVLNDVGADVSDNACFDVIQIFIGGHTVSGICAELNGYKSQLECRSGYILGADELLDINNIVIHKGRKSRSNTDVKGVLSGNAVKTFRGTIDFNNGASGSVGAETEDVLLLNENVTNKTIPVILCSEEDVEGSHGASIGRLPDDVLYYMTSRGISLERAHELMAAARLESLINGIGDVNTSARALNALAERSGYAVL